MIPGSQRESLLNCMVQGPQLLVKLSLFKPGVWSHALGRILSKVQRSGFTVVGLHVLVLDNTTAVSLASAAENQDPSAVEAHVQYLSSGPSLALCLQRENAVKRLLDVLGPEDLPRPALRTNSSGEPVTAQTIYTAASMDRGAIRELFRM
ncbi:uncharacterized protein LOC116374327 [Oncorhynchus kisutch]|uniref:uncharacterized protein LOC116374327 n=1 Tax=Oncorhynchus kisutch TaxID=8019 RepID=UPI0012DD751E|nr:uncharacterized protein LOC116374327 [Oncorhynchus kisutch]